MSKRDEIPWPVAGLDGIYSLKTLGDGDIHAFIGVDSDFTHESNHLHKWRRGTDSNCRHGDFQTKFLKMQKYRNCKQLILFQFFIVFLVSFGNV
jgi:hypothetical protein